MSPRALIRVWDRFWFAPTSARPLGAFRIVFGPIVLLNLALIAPDIDVWFTDAGRLRGNEPREMAGAAWSEAFNVPMRWSPLQTYRDPWTVRAFFLGTAVAAVGFTLGWRTRVMSVAVYAGMLSIHHANLLTNSGADALLTIVCFLMMLSPCGAAYSLDARRRARGYGGAFSALVSPWPQRLIAIQVSVVYFMAGILKAGGKTWIDGTALHYVLSNAEIRRFDLGLTAYPSLINAMTLGTVITEVALAFLLWVRAARPLMIAIGVTLHCGIMLTINIPIFGELMMATYLCFLTAGEWDVVARRLDPRRLFGRGDEAARGTPPGPVDRGHGAPAGPHAAVERIRENCSPLGDLHP